MEGNIGLDAVAANYAGFVLALDASGQFSTDVGVVTGNIYAYDYSGW